MVNRRHDEVGVLVHHETEVEEYFESYRVLVDIDQDETTFLIDLNYPAAACVCFLIVVDGVVGTVDNEVAENVHVVVAVVVEKQVY